MMQTQLLSLAINQNKHIICSGECDQLTQNNVIRRLHLPLTHCTPELKKITMPFCMSDAITPFTQSSYATTCVNQSRYVVYFV